MLAVFSFFTGAEMPKKAMTNASAPRRAAADRDRGNPLVWGRRSSPTNA
jgi:hypothetical protein